MQARPLELSAHPQYNQYILHWDRHEKWHDPLSETVSSTEISWPPTEAISLRLIPTDPSFHRVVWPTADGHSLDELCHVRLESVGRFDVGFTFSWRPPSSGTSTRTNHHVGSMWWSALRITFNSTPGSGTPADPGRLRVCVCPLDAGTTVTILVVSVMPYTGQEQAYVNKRATSALDI